MHAKVARRNCSVMSRLRPSARRELGVPGRASIYYPFGGGNEPEYDFGRSIGSVRDIEKQQLEVSEGLEVVLYYDDGDDWMLVDATVDRFNPDGQYGGSWVSRLDRSTFRRLDDPG